MHDRETFELARTFDGYRLALANALKQSIVEMGHILSDNVRMSGLCQPKAFSPTVTRDGYLGKSRRMWLAA